ncbi:hypothetical protein [Halomonas garicola]|uniref:hypothetical protein n=1 Tax=Halomonas garicola TaxID=1690008 RepID=UPI00289CD9C5|nr:hypothetical protein [Halomonas garicola]
MNPEVVRRQYLDAMGITAYASRYRLPNALATQACEWDDAPPEPESPGKRLHALLDDAQQVEASRRAAPPAEPSANPAALKALLNEERPAPPSAPVEAPPKAPAAPAAPLRFTLSCVCLGGRWLSLHEGEPGDAARRLLSNLCRAAGIDVASLSAWHTLSWPPLVGGPAPEAPLEEAREGLCAFVDGAASRNGWKPTRVLWWGGDDASPLARVLAPEEERGRAVSQALSLPLWQGPALETLLEDGAAKRDLWPALAALGAQWRKETADG